MKETIKKSFIGGIVFLGTILTGFFSFAAYISLPTQNSGDTITQTIWNDVINRINNIGNNVDSLSGTVNNLTQNTGLGVGQTWQDVTASRVAGTTYTNNTGKPIQVRVSFAGGSANLTVNGIVDSQVGYYRDSIIPNGGTYSVVSYTPSKWLELR